VANRVDQWLRSMGIRSPSDMTEAQMEDRDTQNPLSKYGFMSGQEKQRRLMIQQAHDAQLQRENELLQQQMLARMSSQGQIGQYMGQGLLGLVSHLKGKGVAPEVPDVQDDPQVSRFNQLAAEVGPIQARMIMGNEMQNPGMIEEAKQMMAEEQKARLEMEDLQGRIDERKKPKANQTVRVPEDRGGVPGTAVYEVIPGANGENRMKFIGWGVDGSVTDTKEGWGGWNKTSGKNSESIQAFENAAQALANTFDLTDSLVELVDKSPNSAGWSGQLIAKADNIIEGVKNIGDTILTHGGREMSDGLQEKLSSTADWDWTKLGKVAKESHRMQSVILQLAYARAAATGDSSRSLSDRDVQNQIDQIGGSVADPATFKQILDDLRKSAYKSLVNRATYTTVDGKRLRDSEVGKRYLDELGARIGAPKTRSAAPKPGEVRNGFRFKSGNPNDKNNWEPVK